MFNFYGLAIPGGRNMSLVKKTIELEQDAINRIKAALNVRTEKEAINTVLRQFDTDIRLAEITFKNAGSFDFEGPWKNNPGHPKTNNDDFVKSQNWDDKVKSSSFNVLIQKKFFFFVFLRQLIAFYWKSAVDMRIFKV